MKEWFPIIYKKGRRFQSGIFQLFVLAIPGQKTKASFIISQKILKKAVERNKVKRRGRAVISRNFSKLKKNQALVFVLKSYNDKISFADLEENICRLLREAKIL